jgi:hypothetical protein
MSDGIDRGVLDLPVPSAPGAAVDDPPLSKLKVLDPGILLCKWKDSGGWWVELKHNGALYKDGFRTARGVTENIYFKGADPTRAKSIVIYKKWSKIDPEKGDYVASPGSAPLTVELTVTHAVTTKDSYEISAQFGFNYKAISAEFAAKFGHSLTVSDETSVKQTFTFPSHPKYYAHTIVWQASTVIRICDVDGNLVEWADGDVWAVIIPDYTRIENLQIEKFQSLILPPGAYDVPYMTYPQTTYFDIDGNRVSP